MGAARLDAARRNRGERSRESGSATVILSELAGFLPFAAAMSFTPGPNNLMLANSQV